MKELIALSLSVFSFILIDLNLLRRTRNIQQSFISISDELEDHKSKTRRQRRLYKNKKYKKRKIFKNKVFKLKGTNSKDPRYSNQKKLRRMYRGC